MNICCKKSRLREILEYGLALCIILDCNSIYINRSGDNADKYMAIFFVSVLLMILFKEVSLTRSIMKQFLILIIPVFLYLGLYVVINVSSNYLNSFIFKFYMFFSLILLYFVMCKKVDETNTLLKRISDIMVILAVISVVLWLLCSVLKILPFNSNVLIWWGGKHFIRGFYNLYYETQKVVFGGYTGYRNTGIFTEAPMYSLCLSIALLTECFFREKINLTKIIILVITIISTFSVSGYIVSIICLAGSFFQNRGMNKKTLSILRILFGILILVIGIYLGNYLITSKMSTNSFVARSENYADGFKVWKENIFFGNGFGKNESGSSNSLMVILADGGIYLFIFYLISLCKFLIFSTKREYKFFGIGFLWLIIVAVFPYSLMTIMLLALGYSLVTSN